MFQTYFELGITHILDPNAYDHLLFIVALVAIYQIKEWRKVAILVTAFTLGHSITLALSAYDIIRFDQRTIEILIPVTILITAVYNIIGASRNSSMAHRNISINYAFAAFFGLIHGMAFSNELKASLFPGKEDQLLIQLLGFNVGIELGQLVIVGGILAVSYVAFDLLRIKPRWWIIGLSSVVALFAIDLLRGLLA